MSIPTPATSRPQRTATEASPLLNVHPQNPPSPSPLLGPPGALTPNDSRPLYQNLLTGTAPLAQFGALLLFAHTWTQVFTHPLLPFSPHPLLNSLALLLATQAILILQPTHAGAPRLKHQGAIAHGVLWLSALACAIAAGVVVEWWKQHKGLQHFKSAHAIVGVAVYVVLLLQAGVGVVQLWVPRLVGGRVKAKRLYKWHRAAGYVVFTGLCVNVGLAAGTGYAKDVLELRGWAMWVGAGLVVVGVGSRLKVVKMEGIWKRG